MKPTRTQITYYWQGKNKTGFIESMWFSDGKTIHYAHGRHNGFSKPKEGRKYKRFNTARKNLEKFLLS